MIRAPALTQERRFLSVLFCDMIDSTGHQFRMDPEQFEGILCAYRDIAFSCIRNRGGYVARVVGDAILATFGWPRAAGHDAEAAVACALEIGQALASMERLGERPAGVAIGARMAIETGWVLVGRIGEGPNAERDGLIGNAPNIASRLQKLAKPNGLVVGEATIPLLPARFVIEELDASGIDLPTPIRAAAVLGISDIDDPFGRLRTSRRAPLVGRKAELSALRAQWDAACASNGQVALISGEPGVGKTRLSATLLEGLAAGTCTPLWRFIALRARSIGPFNRSLNRCCANSDCSRVLPRRPSRRRHRPWRKSLDYRRSGPAAP